MTSRWLGPTELEAQRAARAFRDRHGLGVQGPLSDLVMIIEQSTDVDVAVVTADQDQHGLTMRNPDLGTIFIAVASTREAVRQRSTLAHELAHVEFGDWQPGPYEPALHTAQETRANAFARHLLVPLEALEATSGPAESEDASLAWLSHVVQRFLVSPSLAAIAMEQAGWISEQTKQRWRDQQVSTWQLAARYGWSDQYSALALQSSRTRAPQKLLTRAIQGYVEGLVSVREIATIRGVSEFTVVEELSGAGITGGRDRPVSWMDTTTIPDPEVDLALLDDLLGDDTGDGYDDHRSQ